MTPSAPITIVFDTPPPAGTSTRIVDDLRWVRMPLPFALDHVNLWLLRDRIDGRDGWTAIDAGADTPPTRHAWDSIIERELDGLPLLRVLCTHMHPDHIGLAHWLCERFDAPLWMTAAEYTTARVNAARLPGADARAQIDHFTRHGIADEVRAALEQRGPHYERLVPAVPLSYRRIIEGDRVAIGQHEWRVIIGRGHSPEHASLYCEQTNVLIAGDMMLPKISTNVSVAAMEPEGDPLGLFLDSLQRYTDLPHDVLVLPSHGLPFRGAHARIAQLVAHHDARLAEALAACAKPHTAAEIVPVLYKRALDAHQIAFALGEALAHLHRLRALGKIRRAEAGGGVTSWVVA